MSNMNEIIDKGNDVLMKTYGRIPLVLEKGDGCYLYDKEGNKYLDFVAGIAVNSLGYNDKGLNEALEKQMKKLYHVSNLYYTQINVEAAKLLVDNSKHDEVFFCNSGAEAIEGSMKLARMYKSKFGNGESKIITMQNSFHGRTYGAITATGQLKYQKNLDPLLPGVAHVPFNDYDALAKETESNDVCAVIIEPIQGEGGIRPSDKEYLRKVRELCDKKDIVLIFDEVQCGTGRTGEFFAYDYYGVVPDVVAMAKGLGGGFPVGAVMAKREVSKAFEPGAHASTFGGNALASKAVYYTTDKVINGGVLENVKKTSVVLKDKLNALKEKYSFIKEVRGVGLMMGIELDFKVADIIKEAMDEGLLLLNSGENIIRFVPPLIISEGEISEGIEIIDKILSKI